MTGQNNTAELVSILADALTSKTMPYGLDTLWDTQSVADYLRFSLARTQAIVGRESFPAPFRADDKAHPRWFAGDVIQWAQVHRQRRRKVGRPREKH